MLNPDEVTKLQTECEYFRQIILDIDLENLWHTYVYRGDEVEGIAEFEARIHDLPQDLQLPSGEYGGYPESVIRRVIDVERA